jgi:capsular exopolysaccharide synthesis family protein
VLLIGADLRKPRIKEILNMNTNLGLSNFLANKELKKEDIIFTSTLFDHSVDVIQSGSIPPNPSELLMNSRFDELMNELKQEYDFIIIDNAPVGLVIDAVTTNRFVDVTLYVIRSGMVDKRVISRISELVNNKKLTNLCVLLNDVKSNNQGYSYTYGYGNEANTAPWWKRLLGVS